MVENARSHNGLMTYTDHRLMRARFNLERMLGDKQKSISKVNLESLKDPVMRGKYRTNIEMRIMDDED